MNLVIPKGCEVLLKKVFGHTVFKQSLLYHHRIGKISKFSIYSPPSLISQLQEFIKDDGDLKKLTVKILPDTTKKEEGAVPLNRLYDSTKNSFDLFSLKDLQLFKKRFKQSIIVSTPTPVAKYINKKISIPLSSLLAQWNVAPNTITFFALLSSVVGFVLAIQGYLIPAFLFFST